MKSRVAIISIIVKNTKLIEQVNELLHSNGEYIIGRMGLPYREKNLNIICIAMDAPANILNALAGKLGAMEGVTSKVVYGE